MTTTNTRPQDLNYDHYTTEQYDRDIINAIPFHREIHEHMMKYIHQHFDPQHTYKLLDLGVGTGLSSKMIQDQLPQAHIDVMDFSEQMLTGARKRLGTSNVRYILGDYAELEWDAPYDLILSIIGIHHQTHEGKKQLFQKIAAALRPGGTFIFGDLVTYRDPQKAAYNQALHYHHLVENAHDPETLKEWAHHHMILNNPAPIEDQKEWLEAAGFTVDINFLQMNTALLFCTKH